MDNFDPKPNIWEQNPKLKSLLLVLIVIFLVSGMGLTLFAVWGQQYRQQVYEETEAGLPKHDASKSANQLTSESETEGWKTYRNEEYGFEFDYPRDWNLKEEVIGMQGVLLNQQNDDLGSGAVSISRSNFAGTLKDFIITDNNNFNILENKILKYSDINWTYQLSQDKREPTLQFITVYAEKNGAIYSVASRNFDSPKELINKILETFKFITPTQTEDNQQLCAQVITRAKNTATGEIKDFPDACLPDGWVKISN